MKYIFILYFFAGIGNVYARNSSVEPPNVISMNQSWSFTKDAYNVTNSIANTKVHWQPVKLPHTWNMADVVDDVPGYYRGACWYKKSFTADAALQSKDVFLYFESANQETEVYINGIKAGGHTGGYTAFYIPVNRFLQFNKKGNINEIVVKVNNQYNETIPPLMANFTFYGGIYRDVCLMAFNKVHFTCNDNASKGIYITTPTVSKQQAAIHIEGIVNNNSGASDNVNVRTKILDKEKNIISETAVTVQLTSADNTHFTQDIKQVNTPHLWSTDDPYLYTVITEIIDAKSGELLDRIINPLGFRWIKFDADKGFLLNGVPHKLIGTSRHQDYEGLGNAVSKVLSRQDVMLIKEMGGNFLRIAHYPQDPSVLQACDSLGILTSIEILVVNEITESESFTGTA